MEERLARNPRKKQDILKKENIIIDTIEGHKDTRSDIPAEFTEKLEKALFEIEDKEEIQAMKKEEEELKEEFNPNAEEPHTEVKAKVVEIGKYQIIDWEKDESLQKVTK